jgi:hypothetical protein
MNHFKDRIKIIRWVARIWGTAVLAILLFFLIASIFGAEGLGAFKPGDEITFLFFPISTIVGLALAWRWEGLGGLIATVGLMLLFVVRLDLVSTPTFLLGIFPPGILYLLSWYFSKRTQVVEH